MVGMKISNKMRAAVDVRSPSSAGAQKQAQGPRDEVVLSGRGGGSKAKPSDGPATVPLAPDGEGERAKWVADMFQVSNHEVARDNPAGLATKKGKMKVSAYSYFRGADTAFNLSI